MLERLRFNQCDLIADLPLSRHFHRITWTADRRVLRGHKVLCQNRQSEYCLLLCSIVLPAVTSTVPARHSRTYPSRNVARSTVSRSRTVVYHARTTSVRCPICERDVNGRIKRDPAARLHRDQPGDGQPGGGAVLQQAGDGGAVDQGRQAGSEDDEAELPSVPVE